MKYIDFGKPFVEMNGEHVAVGVDIDLRNLIDYHDYHDAPSSVQEYVRLDSLLELKKRLDATILKAERLQKKIKKGK